MKDIEERGRTIDAVVNPKNYAPFSKISDKETFDNIWKSKPDVIFANMAHAAYHDEAYIKNLFKKFGATIKFYQSEPDTMGLVRGREAFMAIWNDKAILAFRGTEGNDKLRVAIGDNVRYFFSKNLNIKLPDEVKLLFPTDLYDDFNFKKVTYRGLRGESQVHGGFYKATMDLWPKIAEDLEGLEPPASSKLFVTGHSLGAAMAVIAGIKHSFYKIVTFGEPSVGNDLDNTIEGSCPHIRYVNGDDPVTKIVPESLYQPHGTCVKIKDIDGPDARFDHSIINYSEILIK